MQAREVIFVREAWDNRGINHGSIGRLVFDGGSDSQAN